MAEVIEFSLDGEQVRAPEGETLLQTARRLGIAVPSLCYQEGYRADGNCRACVVEVDGERVLAPSCCRQPSAGMVVKTASDRARASQRMVVELLQSDMPASFSAPRTTLCRPQQFGDSRQSRCLHSVHALRARLPRRASQ